MLEKRRTRTTDGQVKVQRAATQTTLKDLFQKTNSGTGHTGKAQDLRPEHMDSVAPSLQTADPHPLIQPSRRPKPSRLFPIFTKISVPDRPQERVISIDDTEVIDITDISSDIDLSTGPPLSSTHLLSPHSEPSRTTSHSPPRYPMALNIHCCESDTNLPHARTRERTHPHKTGKDKELNRRTLGLGDVAPFPSSCSQHVRGLQHSYTSGQAPFKRSAFPSFRQSDEGTLGFLKQWQRLDDISSTPLSHIHRSLTPQQCEDDLQSLRHDYMESHPAFARISIHGEKIPPRHPETWTRRFRPRRANEVLGNEQQAIYLRDWLNALELHLQDCQLVKPMPKGATARENEEKSTLKRVVPRGVKRPRVIRAVTRKRSNKKRRVDSDDDLDDFMILSDTEEGADDPPEDSEDELLFCQRTLARLHRRDTPDVGEVASDSPATGINQTMSQLKSPTRTNFADNLTNTLLITGPPGCGKTAAVYACAEELGWEVFEVYPGIGRRNGANLDHLIGDVGRNHIVQTARRRAPTKMTKLEAREPMGVHGYLAKSKTRRSTGFSETQEAGTEGQPISVEVDGPTHGVQPLLRDAEMVSLDERGISGMCQAESDGSRPIVGQSLVLLEEVDILFKEDGGFWGAVIEFIRCCQRPVVMTCNDPGLVPLGDLPLQKVLVFEPCPSTVAATFLQCLSLTESCLVPHEDLMVLYESTHWIDGIDIPDAPLYPRTKPLPLPDLRRSITQLQMLCAGARHGSASEMHQGEEAEGHVRRSGRPISAECRVTAMGSTVETELWREMRRHSELMSHVDAQFCRSSMATREVQGMEGGTEEGEMGYVVLSTGGWCEEREGLVEELIAEEAIRYSRGLDGEFATGPIEVSIKGVARLTSEEEFRARVEYQSRMVEALQGMIEPPAPLMPQRSVFLDYIPWVRYMVMVDDILERRAREGGGSGRSTRNSMRTGYVRMMGLSEGQREVMRRGLLL